MKKYFELIKELNDSENNLPNVEKVEGELDFLIEEIDDTDTCKSYIMHTKTFVFKVERNIDLGDAEGEEGTWEKHYSMSEETSKYVWNPQGKKVNIGIERCKKKIEKIVAHELEKVT